MSCRFDKELLEMYVDGEIGPLERIFVEEHAKVCSDCASDIHELCLIAHALPLLAVGEDQLPPELAALTSGTLNQLSPPTSTLAILRGTMNNAARFASLIPGIAATSSFAWKGIKRAPRLIWGISTHVLRGGVKLAQVLS